MIILRDTGKEFDKSQYPLAKTQQIKCRINNIITTNFDKIHN